MKLGIWIDKKHAFILDDQEHLIDTVNSEIEDYNPSGGSTEPTRFGNQNPGVEKKMHHRQRNQMKNYIREVCSKLPEATSIVIFGPAEAKLELSKEIEKNQLLKGKLNAVESSDSMSEEQLKKWVKDYFN